MIRLFLALLLLAGCAAPSSARPLATLPVERPWLGLAQVPVTLNGRTQARFIIDTAASETVMTDALIARLGLAGTGEPAHISAATGQGALNYYRLDSLRLGNRIFHRIGAYDFPPLAAPVEADGLLGADILRRHVVEFDLPRDRIILHSPDSDFARGEGWTVVPARQRSDGFLIVDVRIGGLTVPALFDTGAVQNFVNAEGARRMGLRFVPDSESRSSITGASGHVQTMNQLELSSFALGDAQLGASRLGVVDLAIFGALGMEDGPAMLLSTEALAGRRFIVDYPRSRLLIARTPG